MVVEGFKENMNDVFFINLYILHVPANFRVKTLVILGLRGYCEERSEISYYLHTNVRNMQSCLNKVLIKQLTYNLHRN